MTELVGREHFFQFTKIIAYDKILFVFPVDDQMVVTNLAVQNIMHTNLGAVYGFFDPYEGRVIFHLLKFLR